MFNVPSKFDTANECGAIDEITAANKGFIDGLDIKLVQWFPRRKLGTKQGRVLLVGFTHPEHANAAIRHQLVVQNEVLNCVLYEAAAGIPQRGWWYVKS